MRKESKMYLIMIVIYCLIASNSIIGQELSVKIGYRDIIKSDILKEDREILIHLPDNYDNSDKSYPVIYRLDGDVDLLLETVTTVNRLTYSDEITPEMIIVAIKNINRNSNMWPVNTRYYPEPNIPGADSFLSFIGEELLPYIDNKYRTANDRIICGQSLSSLIVLYAFLDQPGLFDSYIASSASFPDCEEFFRELADKSLLKTNKFHGRKIFITNGMRDHLDPNGVMHKQMSSFTNMITSELGDKVSLRYVPYENEGHVPFHSLYDGLKFIY